MTFRYRGLDRQGKRVRGTVVELSIDTAKKRLLASGIHLESIRPVRPLFRRAAPPSFVTALGRNLSLYLRSAIPITRALQLVAEGYEKKSRPALFLEEVRSTVEAGARFSEALQQQGVFRLPPFFVKTVEVAEQGGHLERALQALAEYLQEQERIRRDVLKAFVYPVFILLVAVAMIDFMLTVIVPKIVTMFETTGSALPWTTRITLALSEFFQQWSGLLAVGFVLFIGGMVLAWRKAPRFAAVMDRFVLRIPLIGGMLLTMELGRFARVMALLIRSGVPFAQALRQAALTVENRHLRGRFLDASRQVVEGKSFAMAVRSGFDAQIVPADFVNAIALGERSSHLAESLENIAQLYAWKNRDRIEVMLAMLEPALMLIIGAIIGFLVLSMLQPIFSLSLQGSATNFP